jgi:hypothetical protein
VAKLRVLLIFGDESTVSKVDEETQGDGVKEAEDARSVSSLHVCETRFDLEESSDRTDELEEFDVRSASSSAKVVSLTTLDRTKKLRTESRRDMTEVSVPRRTVRAERGGKPRRPLMSSDWAWTGHPAYEEDSPSSASKSSLRNGAVQPRW